MQRSVDWKGKGFVNSSSVNQKVASKVSCIYIFLFVIVFYVNLKLSFFVNLLFLVSFFTLHCLKLYWTSHGSGSQAGKHKEGRDILARTDKRVRS